MRSHRLASSILPFLLILGLLAAPAAAEPPHQGKSKGQPKHAAALKPKPMLGEQKIEHVLNRLGYGPRPGDMQRMRQMGAEAYIEQQLHPENIDDGALEARLQPLETLRMTTEELALSYPQPALVKRLIEAIRKGEPVPPRAREFYDRILKDLKLPADLNATDVQKVLEQLTPQQKQYLQMHSPQRMSLELQQAKLLRAVYSERQLLEQMADFWMNHFNVFMGKGEDRWLLTGYERDAIRPNALGKFHDLLLATARHPAMLYYLDNFQSVAPGTAGKRGLNENYARELMELHTLGVDGGYTQKDVIEVARCFTGWTIRRPQEGAEFTFNARAHDNGEKTVLGVTIPAGGGEQDGLKVIDMLAGNPATARFIATKLARRFVSDHPPEALVSRVTETFQQTGGDIRETLRAIFTAPDFFAAANYRAKVKKPFELVASALRSSGAEVAFSPALVQTLGRMGEPLYLCEPPTGYPDVAESWVNTGSMLNRINFAAALAANQVPNVRVKAELVNVPNVGEKTRAAVKEETQPARVAALLLGSPEFQRR